MTCVEEKGRQSLCAEAAGRTRAACQCLGGVKARALFISFLLFGLGYWAAGCGDSGGGGGGIDAAVDEDASSQVDGAGQEDAASPDSGAQMSLPMCVWNQAYQENYEADTVAEILAGAKNCYVLIDPFDSEEARNAISQMKDAGNVVGCYISVGTCENWRDDYEAMKAYCVDKEWGQWAGEYFVDRTDTGILDVIDARIDKMAGWGCDMVEFDNMDWAFDDAYRSEYGFHATPEDAKTYLHDICAHTRAKGMMCMAKSTTEGAEDFDGLTVESYPDDKDWWEKADMQDILDAGRLGIIVHYDETDCDGVYGAYQSEYGDRLSFICEDRNLKKYVHFNQ